MRERTDERTEQLRRVRGECGVGTRSCRVRTPANTFWAARGTRSHECERCTHECVRHRCIRALIHTGVVKKCGLIVPAQMLPGLLTRRVLDASVLGAHRGGCGESRLCWSRP